MKKVLAALGLVLTVLIGFFIYSVYSDEDPTLENQQETVSQQSIVDNIINEAEVTVASEETENRDIHISREEYQAEDYHISMSYPVFESDELNQEIKDYKDQVIDEFLVAKSDVSKPDGSLHYLTTSFELNEIGTNLYSIVFEEFSELAPMSPYTQNKSMIVDTSTQEFVDPISAFENENLENLVEIIRQRLEQEYSDYFFEEDFNRIVKNEKLGDYIYFTDTSMVVSFSQYLVTAGAAGAVSLEFDHDAISHLLTEEWADQLDSADDNTSLVSDEEIQQAIEEESETKDQEVALEDRVSEEAVGESDDPEKKQVALTFDDGPHGYNTQKILNLLDQYDAKGTFFMVGSSVEFYPEVVKKVHQAGHEIGNHTWNHPDLVTQSDEQINFEIFSTDLAIEKIIGERPSLYRPPYGSTNQHVNSIVGKPSIMWDVDTLDWKNRNPQAILENVKTQTRNNSIILMHDIHDTTVQGLALSLEYLSSQGYEFVTVSELNGY